MLKKFQFLRNATAHLDSFNIEYDGRKYKITQTCDRNGNPMRPPEKGVKYR